jgi:ribosome maturation factor RimP
VSSPGLDRPLKKESDFVRFAGQQIRIRLRQAIDGQRNFTGVLAGIENGRLRLESAGTVREFELDRLEKARLVPKYRF